MTSWKASRNGNSVLVQTTKSRFVGHWILGLLLLVFSLVLRCSAPEPETKSKSGPDENQNASSRAPSYAHSPKPMTHDIQLEWPIPSRRISGEFLDQRTRHRHKGIDILAPKGTRIYAPAAGTVVYVGTKFKGYGKLIVIEHSKDLATFYGHCSRILVHEGEKVRQGKLIGLVGRTGRATAPHLHFEVRVDQLPVDPLEFLP